MPFCRAERKDGGQRCGVRCDADAGGQLCQAGRKVWLDGSARRGAMPKMASPVKRGAEAMSEKEM